LGDLSPNSQPELKVGEKKGGREKRGESLRCPSLALETEKEKEKRGKAIFEVSSI